MSDQKNILTGAENIRWDLSDLFSGFEDPNIDGILVNGKKAAADFCEKYKNKLSELSAQELAQAYQELVEILSPVYLVSQYANLRLSTDNQNDKAKSLVANTEEVFADVSNSTLFFDLEIGALETRYFEKFKDAPELADLAYKIKRCREHAKYNLSEKEEQIINIKNLTGKQALTKLYDELTSSFQFEFKVDGEIKTYTGEELRALRQHPDAVVRRGAMKLYFERYQDNKIVLTHIFNNVVKDFNKIKDLRGYKTPISVMNIGNDLEEKVVQNLIDVTTESNVLVNRYYKLKSKLIGLDDLTLADVMAPMPQSTKTYTWDDAKSLVLNAFQLFDDEFYQLADQMFTENRIDGPVIPNKRGGAFCSYATPDVAPFVFLNFTGQIRDVSTMAHEIGHAIHGMLSRKQNLFNYHSILPLAETASIFSEMVLTDMLLKQNSDKALKISLLTNKLEDIISTSHRQNMFSRFEIQIHDQISNQLLSADELCEIYKNGLKDMFGDSVRYTPEYEWEWSTIPHLLHVPFYVYAYNFANLLVIALYQQYLEEGESFIPKFKECLAMGSSAKPTDIIAVTGQDISDPYFWQKSIKYIKSLIDQLEELVG